MITEKTFFKYIKCPTWVYFDAHSDQEKTHDALHAKLIDDGLLPELEREILSDRSDMAEVTAEDPEEAFKQTLAFMREGRETIYHAVLLHGHWVGNPDVLEKVEGRSKFGPYYYVAADIKSSRRLLDDYKFQGCFYAELLERIQGAKPVQGYIITPEKKVLPYLIEEFEAAYKLTLHDIERTVAGDKPVHFLTAGCKQSPWFPECRLESERCSDLSVLNRVWREEVTRLKRAGLTKIEHLTRHSLAELQRQVPDIRPERLEMFRLQAQALEKGQCIFRKRIVLPEADPELYFDIESNPLRDFSYLFGVLEVRGGKTAYHSFLAPKPGEEAAMWKKFIAFIEGRIDAPIYHYGWYEEDVIRLFIDRYGCPRLVEEALEKNMIDLLDRLRPCVVFPLSFYSLKDLGKYVGFEWRTSDATGADSILWHEKYLKNHRKAQLQQILDYNEDDVTATYRLQRWLRENAT